MTFTVIKFLADRSVLLKTEVYYRGTELSFFFADDRSVLFNENFGKECPFPKVKNLFFYKKIKGNFSFN